MKLFKTKKSENLKLIKPKNSNEIIHEIHNAFYQEVDNLLKDANITLSKEINYDATDKARRLRALGFNKSKEVINSIEIEREIKIIEQDKKNKKILIDAIDYFSKKYPHYKFITKESVKKICKTYDLVYSISQRYTGDIPDENLKQIEEFKIDEDDFCFKAIEIRRHSGKQIAKYGTKNQIEVYRTLDGYSVRKCSLEIVAPATDFDLSDTEIEDYKIVAKPILDPVVLQPVIFEKNKFYLIVTAWGAEANDPLIKNECKEQKKLLLSDVSGSYICAECGTKHKVHELIMADNDWDYSYYCKNCGDVIESNGIY